MTAREPSQEVDINRSAQRIAMYAMGTYKSRAERAALRCALGDAAHLCDILSEKIKNENRGRSNKVSANGQRLAEIAKRCGDEIWAMRERIIFEDECAPPSARLG